MNTLDLAIKKVILKKVSSTHGGEWQGPCPGCGGQDRFHVWPEQNQKKGAYWCRSCGKTGDNIQFLIEFEGMDFKEACQFLNIHMETTDHKPEARKTPPSFTPTEHQSPAQLWQEKAEKFINWAQENLKNNPEQVAWLAARGINQQAAEEARLGWNPGEDGKDIFRARKAWGLPEIKKENGKPRMLWIPCGLVIPYIVNGVVQRIRVRRPNEVLEKLRLEHPENDPLRYYVVPGSSMGTMIVGPNRRAFVIIESELDAIACAAATSLAGAVSVGTLQGKPDAASYAILKESIQILNALDYGDQGGGKAAAERAMKWWSENFNDRCDRWPVPKGKDPGEAFAMGIDLGEWIKAGLPPVLTLGNRPKVEGIGLKENNCHCEASLESRGNLVPPEDTPPLLAELWNLLRNNPGVKIINTPDRFTVQRNGKYVGGRINELVFRHPEVRDHILNNPAEEIGWQNLIIQVS